MSIDERLLRTGYARKTQVGVSDRSTRPYHIFKSSGLLVSGRTGTCHQGSDCDAWIGYDVLMSDVTQVRSAIEAPLAARNCSRSSTTSQRYSQGRMMDARF
jgi:hypothetical protein